MTARSPCCDVSLSNRLRRLYLRGRDACGLALSRPWFPRLLTTVRRWSHDEGAEQAVPLVEGARGEEEGIRRPVRGGAATERDRPEAVDGDRRAVGGVELTARLILAIAEQLPGIEGVDVAVAEVSDEQVAAEEPEVGRCEGDPPRRVEPPQRGHAPDQMAGGIEGVDEPVPLTRHVVVHRRVLQRVRHVDRAVQIADPERRVARGKSGVGEHAGHVDLVEVAVEQVDGTRVEIRHVEEVAGRRARDREPLVHRSARRVLHSDDQGSPHRPESGDDAVLAGEDEAGRARACAVGHDKTAAVAVEHDASRRALLAPRAWNRDNQWDGAGTDVVERGAAGPIVGDPPWCRRARNQPPGVDHVGIGENSRDGAVGDEVVLRVELGDGGLRTAENQGDDERHDDREDLLMHLAPPKFLTSEFSTRHRPGWFPKVANTRIPRVRGAVKSWKYLRAQPAD